MGKLPMTDREEFTGMENVENADFSDLELIYHVRESLVAVTSVNHFSNCTFLFNFIITIKASNLCLLIFLIHLILVVQGDGDNYDELVGYLLFPNRRNLNPDEAALLVVGS